MLTMPPMARPYSEPKLLLTTRNSWTDSCERNLGGLEIGEGGSQTGAAGGHTGSQQSEIREQAAADGQFLDLARADHLADFRLGRLNDGSLGVHHNLVAPGSNIQGDVDGGGLAYREHNARPRKIREAGIGDLEFVTARRHIGQHVETSLGGGGRVRPVGIQVAESKGSLGYNGPGRVSHRAAQLSAGATDLRKKRMGTSGKNNHDRKKNPQAPSQFHD